MPRPRPDGPKLEMRRGLYSVVWWEGGERKRLSTRTADKGRAEQALADFEAHRAALPLRLTVDACLTRYAESRLGKVMAHSRLLEAATALRAGLGNLRVDQITQPRWDSYAAGRVTRPRPRETKHVPRKVASGTLRREYNVLRAALRLAWKAGYLDKPPTLEAPPDSAPRARYLTKTEARALIDAADTPHVKVFVALAIYTGARKGSILSLTWERVDFVQGIVDFQEAGRRLTAKRRASVPMNAGLREALTVAHAARTSPYVVEYNGQPVPTGLRWSFSKLCERAGLTWRPTPHHLKHSVASWMAMAGVPLDQAADWLATDARTLLRTYRKFDPTYLRNVAKALEL